MDKFKNVKEALKKYHFWALCVVAIVVAMAAWGYATSDMDKKYRTRKRKLDGAFAKVENISKRKGHPNLELISAIKRHTNDLKEEVLDAWKILYKDQRNNNKLPQSLSEEFKKAFRELELGDDAELESRYRREYLNFIGEHYDELEASIDRWKPATEQTHSVDKAGPGRRQAGLWPVAAAAGVRRVVGGATPNKKGDEEEKEEEEETGTVIWDNPEFRNISTNWKGTPTTPQVQLAQEDFWVYEALIRIIKKVNETATSHANAGVKQINAMQIGNAAIGAWKDSSANVVIQPAARNAARPMVGRGKHADSRYVDDEGEALAADEDSPFAEFNMMPICMNLMMDQRKISKLLVECANSSMPIEVHRVRLCPGKGSRPLDLGSLIAEKGKKPPARRGVSFSHPAMGGYQPHSLPAVVRGTKTSARTSREDISVEILGIIYIYNPPDKAKLGTGTAGKKPEEKPAPPTQAGPEKQQPETVPSEQPVEKPVEKPVDKPVDKPPEGPVKPPAAKPSAGAANTPANTLGPVEATQGHGPANGR